MTEQGNFSGWIVDSGGSEFDGTEYWYISHPTAPQTSLAVVRRGKHGDVTVASATAWSRCAPADVRRIARALLAASDFALSLISAPLPIGPTREGERDEAKSAAGPTALSPANVSDETTKGETEISQASPSHRLIACCPSGYRAIKHAQDVQYRVGCYDRPTDIQFVAQNGLDDVIAILCGQTVGEVRRPDFPKAKGVAMSPVLPFNADLSFEATNRRLLVESYERLGVFLAMDNGKMVAVELALMSRRCAGTYGPEVYERIGRSIIQHDRASLGFCVSCDGSPRFVGDGSQCPMCPECIASLESAEEDVQ